MAVAIQPPSWNSIDRLSRTVIKHMYDKYYEQHLIKYRVEDIIKLLNKIGLNENIPDNMRFAWGDGLLSLSATKQAVHDIGTRGQKIKQQNKQAIASFMVVLGENNNILNKKWIGNIAPHSSKRGRDWFVKKAVNIRRCFNMGVTDILCEDKDPQRRNSMKHAFLYSLFNVYYYFHLLLSHTNIVHTTQ